VNRTKTGPELYGNNRTSHHDLIGYSAAMMGTVLSAFFPDSFFALGRILLQLHVARNVGEPKTCRITAVSCSSSAVYEEAVECDKRLCSGSRAAFFEAPDGPRYPRGNLVMLFVR
jgi:hypothetical protein